MMVRGLGTVVYHVADLHRATTWYTQAFQQERFYMFRFGKASLIFHA